MKRERTTKTPHPIILPHQRLFLVCTVCRARSSFPCFHYRIIDYSGAGTKRFLVLFIINVFDDLQKLRLDFFDRLQRAREIKSDAICEVGICMFVLYSCHVTSSCFCFSCCDVTSLCPQWAFSSLNQHLLEVGNVVAEKKGQV